MHPQKDHATLLRAMTKVPNAQLVLMEDFAKNIQLEQMARDLGHYGARENSSVTVRVWPRG